MNNKEFIADLSSRTKRSSKDTASLVSATVSAIISELTEENAVVVPSFGTFEVKNRPARTARNPRTGAEIKIAASKAPSLKAGKALKDQVNTPAKKKGKK